MSTTIQHPSQRHRLAVAPTFGVDAPTGALINLQLLASGREAIGHGFWIDDKTLETALAVITEDGGLLKGYVTHNHAGPCSWDMPDADEAASELNVAGWFSGMSIAKGQLVAGRFDFYDAFKKNYAPQFEQISEMAAKTPALLGLSIEPWGYLVYVDTAGNEYGAAPEGTELLYNGMPALRVTELWAAAFVGDGAATDGLFARLSRKLKSAAQSLLSPQSSPANKPAVASAAPSVATHSEPTSATMKLITELRARFGADQSKLDAAMSIIGKSDKPDTLTLADIEAQLGVKEVTDLRTQLGVITTERDTLRTQLGTKDTEIAALNKKLEAAKTLGFSVDLGAGGGGPASGEANPWSKLTLNVTEQCRIQKADPTRAAALKAAAVK